MIFYLFLRQTADIRLIGLFALSSANRQLANTGTNSNKRKRKGKRKKERKKKEKRRLTKADD
jgi:hypothetical protein